MPTLLFARKYSAGTRPWIGFHHDVNSVTVNVALSDDAAHEGGRLHAIVDARHTVIVRAEGEATVHSSDLFHAVTTMTRGVRYSLILFFDRRQHDG